MDSLTRHSKTEALKKAVLFGVFLFVLFKSADTFFTQKVSVSLSPFKVSLLSYTTDDDTQLVIDYIYYVSHYGFFGKSSPSMNALNEGYNEMKERGVFSLQNTSETSEEGVTTSIQIGGDELSDNMLWYAHRPMGFWFLAPTSGVAAFFGIESIEGIFNLILFQSFFFWLFWGGVLAFFATRINPDPSFVFLLLVICGIYGGHGTGIFHATHLAGVAFIPLFILQVALFLSERRFFFLLILFSSASVISYPGAQAILPFFILFSLFSFFSEKERFREYAMRTALIIIASLATLVLYKYLRVNFGMLPVLQDLMIGDRYGEFFSYSRFASNLYAITVQFYDKYLRTFFLYPSVGIFFLSGIYALMKGKRRKELLLLSAIIVTYFSVGLVAGLEIRRFFDQIWLFTLLIMLYGVQFIVITLQENKDIFKQSIPSYFLKVISGVFFVALFVHCFALLLTPEETAMAIRIPQYTHKFPLSTMYVITFFFLLFVIVPVTSGIVYCFFRFLSSVSPGWKNLTDQIKETAKKGTEVKVKQLYSAGFVLLLFLFFFHQVAFASLAYLESVLLKKEPLWDRSSPQVLLKATNENSWIFYDNRLAMKIFNGAGLYQRKMGFLNVWAEVLHKKERIRDSFIVADCFTEDYNKIWVHPGEHISFSFKAPVKGEYTAYQLLLKSVSASSGIALTGKPLSLNDNSSYGMIQEISGSSLYSETIKPSDVVKGEKIFFTLTNTFSEDIFLSHKIILTGKNREGKRTEIESIDLEQFPWVTGRLTANIEQQVSLSDKRGNKERLRYGSEKLKIWLSEIAPEGVRYRTELFFDAGNYRIFKIVEE